MVFKLETLPDGPLKQVVGGHPTLLRLLRLVQVLRGHKLKLLQLVTMGWLLVPLFHYLICQRVQMLAPIL